MSGSSLLAQEMIYIEPKIETDKLDWMNLLIYFICIWLVIVSIIEMRNHTNLKKTLYSDHDHGDSDSTDECNRDGGDSGDCGGDYGSDGGGDCGGDGGGGD